ncbi:MAG: oxygen-independent coproporphyrinogen III oxidase [Bacteroidota bacterium]
MHVPSSLIKKYNVPAPRYTSYPTVPFWEEEAPDGELWLETVRRTFEASNEEKGMSLYIHLPFCESLCTYCACNTRITKNHKVEAEYIKHLLAEWDIYLCNFKTTPVLRELHLGGGTPTFFSPESLEQLIAAILETVTVHPDHDFSFEGHPNNTTEAHLQTLYDLGFNRVSFGIQDTNLKVQQAINRVQPFEHVQKVTETARRIGYQSVNFDLIYGLPFQTTDTIRETFEQVASLRPERIAFYSYAHVPWKRPGQRAYSEEDLPSGDDKRKLYELGKEMLVEQGYEDIGMDHFALPEDALFSTWQNGTLSRNFMGYTTFNTDLLIGLGASSISDSQYAYFQNPRKVEEYYQMITSGQLKGINGHFLSQEDMAVRAQILSITCKGKLDWKGETPSSTMIDQLKTIEQDGLITLNSSGFEVTTLGMVFLRNICMVFDKKLAARTKNSPTFSQAI